MHGVQRKTLDTEIDDRWRKKGGAFTSKSNIPCVCPACMGNGTVFTPPAEYYLPDEIDCPYCNGTGEVR